MVSTSYRGRRTIISDSDSDSDSRSESQTNGNKQAESLVIGEATVKKTAMDSQAGSNTESMTEISPSIPRLKFLSGTSAGPSRVPLTPSKTVFTPGRIRKVDFSGVKCKTPGTGRKLLFTPRLVVTTNGGRTGNKAVLPLPAFGERSISLEDIEKREAKGCERSLLCSSAAQEEDLSDEMRSLNLGALRLADESTDVISPDVDWEQGGEERQDEGNEGEEKEEEEEEEEEDDLACSNENIEVVEDEEDVDGLLNCSTVPTSPPLLLGSPAGPSSTSKRILIASPIYVLSDSDSEAEADSIIFAPTPHRTPAGQRRRIVVSDSDSEDDTRSPLRMKFTSPESPIRSRETYRSPSPVLPRAQGQPGPSSTRNRKPAALRFIESQASDDGDGENEGEYDEDEEDSMGSLRDFIVDDDYSSECAESDDEDDVEDDEARRSDAGSGSESDGIELLDTPSWDSHRGKEMRPPRQDPEREWAVSDDEEVADVDDNDLLHFSPPKKVHRLELPDIEALTIISSESESDEDGDHDASGSRGPTGAGTRGKPKSKVIPGARTKTDLINTKTITKSQDASAPTKSTYSAKAWAEERTRIAQSIFLDLDRRVFDGKIGCGPDGAGAKIDWNKRLLTTAGVARSKRITRNGENKKTFWIELSEKVLTGEKQILNTVAHEMCHLANWIISNEYKNPHGRVFKSWGRKVMRARNDIQVTTTHSYVIEYKYEWKCVNERCGKIYKRHSKSIDTAKHACGSCKSKLVPLFESKQKTASAFQLYLKANMKLAKSAMPQASHGDVMRALSKRWNDVGAQGTEADTEGRPSLDNHWRDLATRPSSGAEAGAWAWT